MIESRFILEFLAGYFAREFDSSRFGRLVAVALSRLSKMFMDEGSSQNGLGHLRRQRLACLS